MFRPIFILLSLSLLLSACSLSLAPNEEDPTTAEPIPLRITWPDYGGRGLAVKDMVASFEYPVQVVGGNESTKEIQALLSHDFRGVLILPYRLVQTLGAAGALEDLSSDFYGREAYFYPDTWRLSTVEGKTYGVPWVTHGICLLYNANLLEEAGVDPLSLDSREALLAALAAVEEGTQAHGLGLVGASHNDLSWQFNMIYQGGGGRLVDEEGALALDHDLFNNALHYYRDDLGRYAQENWLDHTGVEALSAFRRGQVAFTFQGLWGLSEIDKAGNPFDVGVLLPSQLGLKTEIGPLMLALPAGLLPEERERAMDLVDYMISPPAQRQILTGEYSPEHDRFYPFRLPARRDLNDRLYGEYRAYLPFLLATEDPSIDVPVPGWQSVKEGLFTPLLHKFMRGEIDAETLFEEMNKEAPALLLHQDTRKERP